MLEEESKRFEWLGDEKSDKVVYCRDGQVEMFSNASDLHVSEARFYGEKVAWDTVFKTVLAEEERKKSSMFRELRGIEEGILANGRRLQGKVVRDVIIGQLERL